MPGTACVEAQTVEFGLILVPLRHEAVRFQALMRDDRHRVSPLDLSGGVLVSDVGELGRRIVLCGHGVGGTVVAAHGALTGAQSAARQFP